MNEWSVRRKRFIFSIVTLSLILLVGTPVFLLLYRAPACFDGKQNGDETGIDCGGSCQLLCTAQSLPLISKGDPRVIKLRDGVYHVVAVVENPNIAAEILRARYTVRLFEESVAAPVRTLDAEIFVPNNGTFIVFEGPLDMGDRTPNRATIEWDTDSFVWQRNTKMMRGLAVRDVELTREDTQPRVTAILANSSLDAISNIELTALVSGEDGNLIAASKTFVEDIDKSTAVPVVFNWSEPFTIKENICGYPVDVALVIDRSGSMDDLGANPPQPLTDVKVAARYFINQLGKNDLYSLVSFANDASRPVDVALGADLQTVHEAINKLTIATTSTQNTNLGAGILAARQELNSSRHRSSADKALVLLTDGVPTLPVKTGVANYPETYAVEAAQLARQDGISIYAIGLGKDVNTNLLKKLSTTTAETYFAPTAKELNNIYNQIATKICKASPAVIDIYMKVLPNESFLR